ncbi:uncharacterized protein LOC143767395 [Ranitomeya variabilis]|uniref:uncharacterized protein LOC143767395 n=1 Tax=Ranitomeya variabilis TaxID=490064 RepID=UPI004056880B
MVEVMAHLHEQDILIVPYLDDLLIIGNSESHCASQLHKVIAALQRLGWIINFKKSRLQPLEVQEFLGLILDSRLQECRLPDVKLEKIQRQILGVIANPVITLRGAMSLLGSLTSCIPAVRWAQYHTRVLQWEVLYNTRRLEGHLDSFLSLSNATIQSLRWWLHAPNLRKGVPWINHISRVLTTDASPTGWGAHMNEMWVQGVWSPSEQNLSSNLKELLAVERALRYFLISLQDHHVRIFSDNQVTIAENHLRSLTSLHIKGKHNVVADFLSRRKLGQGDWVLNQAIFDQITQRWGYPQIDLFANKENKKCRRFCSLNPRDNPVAVDALLIPWHFETAYAFPPLNLIPIVLRKIREDRAHVILIAPFWPKRPWFPWLRKMSISQPWILPELPDLLSQGPIFHPRVASLHLTAWDLKGHY